MTWYLKSINHDVSNVGWHHTFPPGKIYWKKILRKGSYWHNQKSFLKDPLTRNNAIYRDSFIFKSENIFRRKTNMNFRYCKFFKIQNLQKLLHVKTLSFIWMYIDLWAYTPRPFSEWNFFITPEPLELLRWNSGKVNKIFLGIFSSQNGKPL